jgi:hypothetical protein
VIVNRRNGELILIRQVDHCALSGEFTRRWGNARFQRAEPNAAVALASGMHDEGWRDQDDQPLFDAVKKTPVHWRDIDVPRHVVFYAAGIRRVAALDPYAGLLASMHGSGIYARRYGTYQVKMSKLHQADRSVIDAFVAEQEAEQARLKRTIWDSAQRRSEFEQTLWFHYELMQIWDRLSLCLCLNDPTRPAEDRLGPTPLSAGGEVVDLLVRASGDGRVSVEPYPFDAPDLDVAVPARAIPDRPYDAAEDVREAIRGARDATVRCRLVAAKLSNEATV